MTKNQLNLFEYMKKKVKIIPLREDTFLKFNDKNMRN